MDTTTHNAQLYITRDEHAALLAHIPGSAYCIDGPYLQLTPENMTTILSVIDAEGGTAPEGLEGVITAVESTWLAHQGVEAVAA
ncbi:hypothetical protein [Microbacterium sp. Leaf320]|uniref:hypothetical protein n=1 Tax=Microbacterium sp. Leaf320 TaxID=1736334 RepID=UPI0006F691B6|nr:hypothetical protein [Microbacterium sp. Leaf320]KQQ66942.1 hypothetical protein ASF63_06750 [Microbacterium sp. Leaf320]